MKITLYLIIPLILFNLTGCKDNDNLPPDLKQEFPESFSFSVNNPSDFYRNDASVSLQISNLRKREASFNVHAFLIWSGSKEISSQVIDENDDGQFDKIIFNIDLKAKGKKDLTIRYAQNGEKRRTYSKRTQAELSPKVNGNFVDRKYIGGRFNNVSYLKLPPEQTDHSEFIRYEGPGWESEKVGYRFYLDWRNAIDIFGKKVSSMVLQNVGQDGYDSYHEPADWGMDILKVGESLGIGSIAMWEDNQANRVSETDSVDCAILANGPVYSQIRTRYFGWKVGTSTYDLISDLSITAGSRLSKNFLQIVGEPYNLCSGLAKHEDTEFFQSETNEGDWGYIALYGKQSLAGDNLGTAIFFDTHQLIEITEDKINHVVVFKPYQNQLTYYFLAAWEQEPAGIKSKEEFVSYLNQMLKEFANPISTHF